MGPERKIELEVLAALNKVDGVWAIKIPTTGHYNPNVRAYMKMATGVVKGTPDILVMLEGTSFWIEVKSETGRQSVEQKEFEKKCKSLDMGYYVVRSVYEAVTSLSAEREKNVIYRRRAEAKV